MIQEHCTNKRSPKFFHRDAWKMMLWKFYRWIKSEEQQLCTSGFKIYCLLTLSSCRARCLLGSRRSPYTNRMIIASGHQYLRPPRIPAHAIHGLFVARQNLYWMRTSSVPYIDLPRFWKIIRPVLLSYIALGWYILVHSPLWYQWHADYELLKWSR